jgi:uncharacterized membrane protein
MFGAFTMEFFVEKVIVKAPVAYCYREWRNFPNLPLIFHNVKAIYQLDKHIWRWELLDTFGDVKYWDLLLVEDTPNCQITWRTLAGPELDMSANIIFEANGPHESEIMISLGTVHVDDDSLTRTVSELLKITGETLARNLHEFKSHVEQAAPVISPPTA